MPHIPGLRSPYDEVGGIVHFGRMLDKIRLHALGKLPPDYVEAMGTTHPRAFDRLCVTFLHVDYTALSTRAQQGGTDEEILDWAFENGRRPTEDDIMVWNAFMTKRGWRDDVRARVIFRLNEAGISLDCGAETMFDFIDLDEGRPLRQFS